MPALRKAIPGLPKNSAGAFLKRLERVLQRLRRRRCHRLYWNVPSTGWAIDGTWFDQRIGDHGRRALVVVELNSRRTLCVQSVPGERAGAVVECLQRLVAKHGAPLVLKADNGSAFISRLVADFCQQHEIALMHSPVSLPSWNGTCEVSGRWAKARATEAARQRGASQLTQADLDCAVTYDGVLPPVDPALRASFRAVLQRELAAAAAEQGLALDGSARDHVRRSLGRVAAKRALQICHILTIEGRGFPQWLPRRTA